MGANNYQYNAVLKFSADTTQAKTAIQELQGKLAQISSSTDLKVDATGIQKASKAAEDLQVHLSKAMNADTGKLDLNKFDLSLKSSGQSLKGLSKDLLSLGSGGKEAFIGLAKSVAEAERPMFSLGSTVKDLADSFKNTVKWQLSSSLIHGFMSCLQQAKGYAEDLNKSLTDIRIVSGASSDEMARFAQNANKAAKSLSSTTNAYAQAALIYYQQGLSDEEVLERTNVTIKMANAVGESASTISDQMTAVWNNFYDGSKTVEYYADVMTALGAATASSTDEIAAGLEKFASVAETVGLSYEYATAALTTITATTRQSADTVGTALKTLFARLEGLKLDGVTDDGTDLNKYSQALADVGVNIKDADGQLKDMDTILSETSNKWQQLSKNQQVALAQTVAGVRQYTQFIALMDNWDFMEENLETARNAEGTLTEQAEIYAESWEGAQKRVKASLESIYGTVIDDKFFIGFNNFLADAISGAGEFLKNLGGIKGLLLSVSGIVTTLLAPRIDSLLLSLKNNISILTGSAEKVYSERSAQMNKVIAEELSKNGENYTEADRTELANASKLSEAKSRLAIVNKNLSDTERMRYEFQLQMLEKNEYEQLQSERKIETLKEEQETLKDLISTEKKRDEIYKNGEKRETDYKDKINQLEDNKDQLNSDINKNRRKTNSIIKKRDELKEKYQSGDVVTQDEMDSLSDNDKEGKILKEDADALLQEYNQQIKDLNNKQQELSVALQNTRAEISQTKGDLDNYETALIQTDTSIQEFEKKAISSIDSLKEGETVSVSDLLTGEDNSGFMSQLEAIEGKFQSIKKNGPISDETKASMEEYKKELDVILEAMPNVSKYSKDVKNALEEVGNAKTPAQYEKALEKLKGELKKTELPAEKVKEVLGSMADKPQLVEKYAKNVKALTEEEKKAADAAKRANDAFEGFNPKHIVSNKEAVTSLFGSLQGLAAGLNSIKAGFESALNPDLSAGERISGFITGMASAATSLGVAYSGLGKVINSELITAMAKQVVVSAMSTKSLEKELGVGLMSHLVKQKDLILSNENIKQKAIEIIMSKLKCDKDKAELVLNRLLNVSEKENIVTKGIKTVATWLAKKATDAETAANWSLLASLGPIGIVVLVIVAAFAALVAVVALVVIGVKALVDFFNANEIAAENAANETKKAAEAAQEAADRYEDLKSSIEELESAKDTLAGLTKGTREWKEAVVQLNGKVLDLIDKYPELAKYMTNDGGVLGISDEGLDALLDKQLEAMQTAQAYRASTKAVQTEGEQKTSDSEYYKAKQQLKQNVFQKRGIVIGQIEESADGSTTAQDRYALTDEEVDQFISRYKENGTISKEDIESITSAKLDGLEPEQLGELIASINSLCGTINVSNEELKANTAAVVNSANPEFENLDSEMSQFATDYMTDVAMADPNRNNWEKEDGGKVTLFDNEEIWSEYEEMLNKAAGGEYTYNVTGSGDSATVTRINSEGKKEWLQADGSYSEEENKKGMSKEIAYKTVLTQKNAVVTPEDYAEMNTILSNYSQKAAEAVSSSEKPDVSLDNIDKIMEAVTQVEGGSESLVSDWVNSQTEKFQNTYKANENLKTIENDIQGARSLLPNSFENFKNFKEGLKEEDYEVLALFSFDPKSKENLQSQFDHFKEEFEAKQKEDAIEVVATQAEEEGFDKEEVSTYTESLMDLAASEEYGKEGAIKLDKSLKEDAEAAGKVAKATIKMNQGIKKLTDGFEDWNDVLQNSNEASQEYAEAMGDIKDALSDVLGVEKKFIKSDFVKDHLKEIEKAATGDENAIKDLQIAMSEDIVLQVTKADSIKALDQELKNDLEAIKAKFNDTSIEIGANLDDADFINAANRVITNAKMTEEEANAYFRSIGYEPEFEVEEVEVDSSQPITETTTNTYTDGVTYYRVPSKDRGGTDSIPIDNIVTRSFTKTVGYNHAKETVQKIAVNSDGTPKIKSLKKIKAAAMNDSSSANAGGKGGSSSGSGGGGSTPKKNNASKKDSESDRYHTITKQLENLKNNYDEISESKDRAFGPAKLALIDKEIKAQDKLIKKQKKYVEDIKKYAKEDLKNLKNGTSTYTNEDGKDIKINTGAKNYLGMDVKITDGVITNYDSLMKKADSKLEAARKKFNSKNSDNEAAKQEWEIAQAQYEAFKEAISKYEETQDLLEDETQNLIDEQRKLLDLKLEKIKFKVEFKLEVKDSQLEYLDYLLEKLEDKAYSTAQAIKLIGKEITNIQKQSDIKASGIKSILETSGIGDKTIEKLFSGNSEKATSAGNSIAEYFKKNPTKITQDQMDQVKDYVDGLLDDNKTLMEYRNSVYEKVMESLDELNEVFDKQKDRIEVYSSMLDAYTNSINLLGRSVTGISASIQKQIIQKQAELITAQFKIDKTRYEEVKKEYDSVMDKLNDDTLTDTDRAKLKKTATSLAAKVRDAQKTVYSSWADAIQAAADAFKQSIELNSQVYLENVSKAAGYLSESDWETQYEQQQEISSRTVEDYKKIYELSKLNRNINKEIGKSASVRTQSKLVELQKQLNEYAAQHVEMTQYDLDYMQKQYDLKLAEIALEEAQNAKSKVTMVRNSEGGFGYVYTTDENKIADAQQKYEDAYYAAQDLNTQRAKSDQDMLYQLNKEMNDAIAAVSQDDPNYKERVKQIQDYYMDKISFYTNDLQNVLNNNQTLYEQDGQRYHELTGYKITDNSALLESIKKTFGEDGIQGYMNAVQTSSSEMVESLIADHKTYLDSAKNLFNEMKLTMGEAGENSTSTIDDQIQKKLNEIDEKTAGIIESLSGNSGVVAAAKKSFEETVTQAENFSKNYGKEMDKTIAKNEAVIASFQGVYSAVYAQIAQQNNGKAQVGDYVSTVEGNGTYTIDKNKKVSYDGRSKATQGQLITAIQKATYNGTEYTFYQLNGKKWVTGGTIKGYDTGGYTGEWGDSGKLAILHQKELVLNQDQTKDLLQSVNILQSIQKQISLNTLQNALGLGIPGIKTVNTQNDSLQQDVSIQATFPNVTNHLEIETAFNNLINQASQYANRNN